MAPDADDLHLKHLKLASNMRKLKARHEAALREIGFLRSRLTDVEPHAPYPPILTGFPERYTLPDAQRTEVTHWKTAREKLLWSGLSATQALHLELTCLTRLGQGQGAEHFPRLLTIDLSQGIFEMTDQGPTLKAMAQAGLPVFVPDAQAQIEKIVAALKAVDVIHLDMHRDGRNLSLDATGRLSLIDFDIAACDGVAFSGEIDLRLRDFQATGGYARFGDMISAIISDLGKTVRETG